MSEFYTKQQTDILAGIIGTKIKNAVSSESLRPTIEGMNLNTGTTEITNPENIETFITAFDSGFNPEKL